MFIYLKEIDLFEKIRDVGLFLIGNGFINRFKVNPVYDGSLRSRVFLEQFNFIVVEIFQIEILWMRVVKRVIWKKNDKKVFYKLVFKRSYSHDLFGKKNPLATNHLHQNVTFFEVDNFGLDFGMYEVNNNIVNSMKIDDVMKNVEYNKKNLNSLSKNYKEQLYEHKLYVLKSIGFKNVKIIKAIKGMKSGENYLLKKIKEIKEC